MAKKVVATLQKKGGRQYTKCVKMVKTDSGSYSFKEEMVHNDNLKEFFAN